MYPALLCDFPKPETLPPAIKPTSALNGTVARFLLVAVGIAFEFRVQGLGFRV